jgi:hypothetical protein
MWDLPAGWTGSEPEKRKMLVEARLSGDTVLIQLDRFPHVHQDSSLNKALLAILPKLPEEWPREGVRAHDATFESTARDKGYFVEIWYLPASPDMDSLFGIDKNFKVTLYPSG